MKINSVSPDIFSLLIVQLYIPRTTIILNLKQGCGSGNGRSG